MKIILEMFLVKIFVCSLMSAFYLEAQVFAGNVEKKVDEFLKAEIEKRHIPGASVAIIRDGKIVLLKSYGLSNVEQNIKA
ncbi:MAG: beta-lactamase family protein, partial [Acidobacteria bacterium]|nr:beta-lactamase family protein [Acidobacteriota bacterium]